MFYIGLDVSSTYTGVAVLNDEGKTIETFFIKTDNKINKKERIKYILTQIIDVFNRYNDFKCGIEYVFVGKNTGINGIIFNAIIIGSIIGYLIYKNIDYYIYYPQTHRRLLGTKTKEETIKFVIENFKDFNNIKQEIEKNNKIKNKEKYFFERIEHEVDAISIAYCCYKNKEKKDFFSKK